MKERMNVAELAPEAYIAAINAWNRIGVTTRRTAGSLRDQTG
ncbi:hypothetical protein [Streptosporangium carneum]|uniref:Uncharacterized protein n=1 Tax=Streptosporangium carneum TaxID=47481 RepID=A0A9W6I4T8_9ACTN|nr:hypothetical protein [Streptosporangium carneum]GLK12092.1 hypothetical protein GCM10017600_55000 [Streptosporangium carneum]